MGIEETTALVAGARHLKVGQVKEWGEILTGFETRNKYEVRDEHGRTILLAAEESTGLGAVLLRMFLKALRPFTMTLLDQGGNVFLRLRRPFRFMFHRIEVFDAEDRPLGAVERRFSLLRRIYDVLDTQGQTRITLFGPVFRPWTFEIRKSNEVVGKIQKKWSGLGRELFTDADNFGIEFSPLLDHDDRLRLLAAVFLIDFVHFENRK